MRGCTLCSHGRELKWHAFVAHTQQHMSTDCTPAVAAAAEAFAREQRWSVCTSCKDGFAKRSGDPLCTACRQTWSSKTNTTQDRLHAKTPSADPPAREAGSPLPAAEEPLPAEDSAGLPACPPQANPHVKGRGGAAKVAPEDLPSPLACFQRQVNTLGHVPAARRQALGKAFKRCLLDVCDENGVPARSRLGMLFESILAPAPRAGRRSSTSTGGTADLVAKRLSS